MKYKSLFFFIIRLLIMAIPALYIKPMELKNFYLQPLTYYIILPVIFSYMHKASDLDEIVEYKLVNKSKYIFWKLRQILLTNGTYVIGMIVMSVVFLKINRREFYLIEIFFYAIATYMIFVLFNIYVEVIKKHSKTGIGMFMVLIVFMLIATVSLFTHSILPEVGIFDGIFSSFSKSHLFKESIGFIPGGFLAFLTAFLLMLSLITVYGVVKEKFSYD